MLDYLSLFSLSRSHDVAYCSDGLNEFGGLEIERVDSSGGFVRAVGFLIYDGLAHTPLT